MEKSGKFVKISPNQGTLQICLLSIAKKSPNRTISKEEARGEGNEAKFKKEKETKTQLKELEKKIDDAQKETLKIK